MWADKPLCKQKVIWNFAYNPFNFEGSVYENEGRECIDETTMGELDESSLQQIENILSLDNDMETTQGNHRNIFKYILRSFPNSL